MDKYQFDFSAVTIGDMLPLLTGSPTVADLLIFANKVIVGGIVHLPPSEIDAIYKATGAATAEWIKTLQVDNVLWNELLEGVSGL